MTSSDPSKGDDVAESVYDQITELLDDEVTRVEAQQVDLKGQLDHVIQAATAAYDQGRGELEGKRLRLLQVKDTVAELAQQHEEPAPEPDPSEPAEPATTPETSEPSTSTGSSSSDTSEPDPQTPSEPESPASQSSDPATQSSPSASWPPAPAPASTEPESPADETPTQPDEPSTPTSEDASSSVTGELSRPASLTPADGPPVSAVIANVVEPSTPVQVQIIESGETRVVAAGDVARSMDPDIDDDALSTQALKLRNSDYV